MYAYYLLVRKRCGQTRSTVPNSCVDSLQTISCSIATESLVLNPLLYP